MLIDSHCHLNFPDFKNDLQATIDNAHNAGVSVLQVICTKLEEYQEIKDIADIYPNIFCSVGVHPHESSDASSLSAQTLIDLAQNHAKTISFGETGLDYYYEHSDRAVQKRIFAQHIEAAQVLGIPLIIHTRDAETDTLDMLQTEMKNAPFSAVIHCFTASQAFGHKCLDLGLYISISGIVTFNKANALQDAVKSFPLERLLVETDSPYLAPHPYRGKRNEPAFCKEVAQFVANLKNISYEEFAAISTANFYHLFSKAKIVV
jgi:TatD DNase family protein